MTERASELLEVLGLTDAAGTLVADYSHGMRKKIALASALLHAPRVVGVGIFVWWPALVVVCPFAVGYGLALWWAGVRAGSDWLRAHAPELLAALKPSRAA